MFKSFINESDIDLEIQSEGENVEEVKEKNSMGTETKDRSMQNGTENNPKQDNVRKTETDYSVQSANEKSSDVSVSRPNAFNYDSSLDQSGDEKEQETEDSEEYKNMVSLESLIVLLLRTITGHFHTSQMILFHL